MKTFSADDVREWHLPRTLACNHEMMVPKFAERLKLAVSDIHITIELHPECIRFSRDFKGVEGRPNTDGNGTISADLLDQVAEKLGYRGRRISAIQGRLGPAKGMFIREDQTRCTVQLFDEMVKYGRSDYFFTCEPCQRTLEVCSNGVVFADEEPRHSGRLNAQLILVLQACGCNTQVFLDLQAKLQDNIANVMINTCNLLHSDFLPSADRALNHDCDLCQKNIRHVCSRT